MRKRFSHGDHLSTQSRSNGDPRVLQSSRTKTGYQILMIGTLLYDATMCGRENVRRNERDVNACVIGLERYKGLSEGREQINQSLVHDERFLCPETGHLSNQNLLSNQNPLEFATEVLNLT